MAPPIKYRKVTNANVPEVTHFAQLLHAVEGAHDETPAWESLTPVRRGAKCEAVNMVLDMVAEALVEEMSAPRMFGLLASHAASKHGVCILARHEVKHDHENTEHRRTLQIASDRRERDREKATEPR